MTTETIVVNTPENPPQPEPEAVENPTAETAVAAEAVVVAAETAVALAEGQAALAIQDAAIREQELASDIDDLEEQVEEVEEQIEQQDRSIDALWQEFHGLMTLVHQMRETLESSLTPQPQPEMNPEMSEPETTSPSTLSDTLAPTSETPMVATAGSEDESPVLEVSVKRHRRRLI